ncbi:MAG TPA: helix-turn-helix domain-containing protein [Streptosporangiaceae bacterium]|jgi:AraC-like DNA-binding protein
MAAKKTERWSVRGLTHGDESWQRIVARTTAAPFALTVTHPDSAGYRGEVVRQWFSDISLTRIQCDPCAASTAQDFAPVADEAFAVRISSGTEVVHFRDRRIRLRPGDTIILTRTSGQALIQTLGRLRNQCLTVPFAALAECGVKRRTLPDCLVFSATGATPVQRVFSGYVAQLDDMMVPMPERGAIAVRNAAIELLAATLTTPDPRTSPPPLPVLRLAMGRYIDSHLEYGDLSAKQLASTHGISVRTVHRLFAETGESLGDVVRRRRLARARAELAASHDTTITAIAARWGFADASHFSRLFKECYGMSPRDYRVNLRPLDRTAPSRATARR